MKYLQLVLAALAVIALFAAIWSPFLWQCIATALILFLVSAAIPTGTSDK